MRFAPVLLRPIWQKRRAPTTGESGVLMPRKSGTGLRPAFLLAATCVLKKWLQWRYSSAQTALGPSPPKPSMSVEVWATIDRWTGDGCVLTHTHFEPDLSADCALTIYNGVEADDNRRSFTSISSASGCVVFHCLSHAGEPGRR